MKCKECEAEGQTSRVYDPGGGVSTAMGVNRYWDEEGKRHVHDPNSFTVSYHCSRGHRWAETTHRECPTCGDWRAKRTAAASPVK